MVVVDVKFLGRLVMLPQLDSMRGASGNNVPDTPTNFLYLEH